MCRQPSLLLLLSCTHPEAGLRDHLAVLSFIPEEAPHYCPRQLHHSTSPHTGLEGSSLSVSWPLTQRQSPGCLKSWRRREQEPGNRNQETSSGLCGHGPTSSSQCRRAELWRKWADRVHRHAPPPSSRILGDPGLPQNECLWQFLGLCWKTCP